MGREIRVNPASLPVFPLKSPVNWLSCSHRPPPTSAIGLCCVLQGSHVQFLETQPLDRDGDAQDTRISVVQASGSQGPAPFVSSSSSFRCRPSHPTARGQLETASVTPSGPSLFNCRRSAFPTHRDACPFLNSRSQPRRPQTPTRARDAPAAIHLIQRLPPLLAAAWRRAQVTRPLQRSPRLSGQVHNHPRRVRALCSGPVKPPSTLSGPVRASPADAFPAPGPTPWPV